MTIIMPSFNILLNVLIGIIFSFSWSIEGNDEGKTTEKIRSIPIFTPEKCSKKVKVGNEVTMHFILRLENEHGGIIASTRDKKELFSFQIGGKAVIIGIRKYRAKGAKDGFR